MRCIYQKIFLLSFIIFLCASCHKYNNLEKGQFLFFEGISNKEVLLSKILTDKNGKKNIIPIKRVFTNSKINLPAGKYMLSNDCSYYEFEQSSTQPKKIYLSHLQLNLLGKYPEKDEIQEENHVVQSLCYNILNQKEYTYKNKVQFDILPGNNKIFISGRSLEFQTKSDAFEDLAMNVVPLSLESSKFDNDTSNFYVLSQSDPKKVVISAPINGKVWLFPGKYSVEVNGTKKIVDLSPNLPLNIQLGLLKISAPKNFPFEKRMKSGGQPISAFIDDKVLIRLNTSYPVFAGKYKVNLEGSELEKEVNVEENHLSEVKTLGSQIDNPMCMNHASSCNLPSSITIHENKLPFILMVVPVGLPFLVFDGQSYQYGVEGIKGIFKTLPTSSDSIKEETLGRVNIKWEVRYTTSTSSTEFVRFEPKSGNLFGKSVDLSFFKPSEVYLPDGDYWLTYYIGDAINQNSPKIRNEVNLANGGSKDVVIPIFVRGVKEFQKDVGPSSVHSSVLVPIKK